MIKIGDKAIEFALYNTDRNLVKLSDFSGKNIVLAFYPGAFTSDCQKELCVFRDSLANFEKMDAIILAISVDSPWANRAFKEQNMFGFHILSDYTRAVSHSYGGIYEDFAGLDGYKAAKRSVFVLDKKGIVVYSWITDNPGIEPDYQKIREIIEKL